jgi:hypothetical protein
VLEGSTRSFKKALSPSAACWRLSPKVSKGGGMATLSTQGGAVNADVSSLSPAISRATRGRSADGGWPNCGIDSAGVAEPSDKASCVAKFNVAVGTPGEFQRENHQEKLGRDVSFFARLGEECPFP